MNYTYEDKINFIVSIYCAARKVSFDTGLSWKTMLAQAAQETLWGEKILSGTNNIFNIKADSTWKGKTKTFKVHEYDSKGRKYYVDSKFAIYESFEESLMDRVSFLKRNPRYSQLFEKSVLGDMNKEAEMLQKCGYATDPNYAKALVEVFNGRTMKKSIALAEEKASCSIASIVFKKDMSILRNYDFFLKVDNREYVKKKTNDRGVIEGVASDINGSIYIKIDNNEYLYKGKNKRKYAIEVNINEHKYRTKTADHFIYDYKKDSKLTTENTNTNTNTNEVCFNIKIVEEDTGRILPNIIYYLEYKKNVKKHKADSLGVTKNIRANVCESINVLLDDDDGKKQSVYSMAFPVTEDLHGTTKVLKVPVVNLNIQFVDKNNRPISGQQFRTVYRGRTSEIRKADAQGGYKINALAGQKLKVIYEPTKEIAECIVTDGNNKIAYTVNVNKKKESVKSENKNNVAISDSQPDDTLTKKEDVIRQDIKTDRGPTHQIKSTSALIKIKFLDEVTNKPLSGLTYVTKSTKYGKNNSVTGSDGTRGRVHESEVGVTIDVLVYENGKEVKKGSFVASSDRIEPYIYKAKKPEVVWHNPLARMELRGWYSSVQWTPGKSDYKGRTGGKHDGLDLYAPLGTDIYACISGTVYEFYTSSTYGNVIGIKGDYRGKTYYFFYAHLSERKFKKHEYVKAGSVIGKTGNTGNVVKNLVKGYHLHFEVRNTPNRTGGRLDPYIIDELKGIEKNPKKSLQI